MKNKNNSDDAALLESNFEQLYSSLKAGNATKSKIIGLCHRHRMHFENAVKLLDLLKNDNDTKIERLALHLQHGKPVQQLLSELEGVVDRRMDYLRGMHCLKSKNYEDALFCFNKISYRLGIEICQLSLMPYAAKRSNDIRIRIYTDSLLWESRECEKIRGCKDLMYRLGLSREFENENNIDTVLATVESRTEREITPEEGAEMLRKLEKCGDNVEALHLQGKIHHLLNDHKGAASMYRTVLSKDAEYLPSLYNLCRIEGRNFQGKSTRASVFDYNALIHLKSKNFSVDTSRCSRDIRKLIIAIKQARTRNAECLAYFEENAGTLPLNAAALHNNMAVLENNRESAIRLLKKAAEEDDGQYADAINYNLGVVSGDAKYFEGSSFPQCEYYVSYFNSEPNTGSDLLNAYISKDIDGEIDVKGDRNSAAFLSALRGGVLLERNEIPRAIEEYRKSARYSAYSLNGLAVCYALQGHVDAAIRLLSQVPEKTQAQQMNLANFYVLKKDYYSAIVHLLRLERTSDVQDLIKSLVKEDGSSRVLALCRKKGVLKEDAEEEVPMDEERKRKVEELENFKRQLTFK